MQKMQEAKVLPDTCIISYHIRCYCSNMEIRTISHMVNILTLSFYHLAWC